MAETIVENEICTSCSTEVPATAVFCYHCGNSIKPEEYPVEIDDSSENEKKSEKNELESAASLKVKAKKLPPRKVEVRWEEYENAPNVWFLGGGLLLAFLALGIFFLAMYLK